MIPAVEVISSLQLFAGEAPDVTEQRQIVPTGSLPNSEPQNL